MINEGRPREEAPHARAWRQRGRESSTRCRHRAGHSDPIARGAFSYAGQSCISVQRLFVHEPIYDDFAERFVAHVRRQRSSAATRARDVMVGPMIDHDAQHANARSDRRCDECRRTVLTGGEADGPCIKPTVIAGAADRRRLAEGDLRPRRRASTATDLREAAIARVNDSPFGLQAGVFTRDIGLDPRARRAPVGGVMINQVPTFRLENMPYGGTKTAAKAAKASALRSRR